MHHSLYWVWEITEFGIWRSQWPLTAFLVGTEVCKCLLKRLRLLNSRSNKSKMNTCNFIKMVNGLYLYSAFLALKVLLQHKSAFTHSHTRSHSKVRRLLYKEPTHAHSFTHQWNSHWEQFGVRDQGHFDMWTEGAGDRTTDFLIGRQPTLPTEPQLPQNDANL